VPQGREGDISRGSRPISRVLSRTVIHLGCAAPHISSDLPGSRAGRTGQIDCPLRDLVLLQVGFTVPPMLPSARCALTAPFHPYSAPISCVCLSDTAIHKFLVLHVSAQRDERGAVSFLWHFPWAHAPQALPGTLPCGARTFLPLPYSLRTYQSATARLLTCSRGSAATRRRKDAGRLSSRLPSANSNIEKWMRPA
jgi:hypothetical protein